MPASIRGVRPASPSAIIDFPDEDGRSCSLLFERPVEVFTADSVAAVRPALRAAERAAAAGLYVVGYVAYEAAPAFEPACAVRGGGRVPLLWFGAFRHATPLDGLESAGEFSLGPWAPGVRRGEYDAAIRAIRDAIGRGAVYQVNFTLRLRARFQGDDLAFYRRMCAAQGAGYFAYLDLGRYRVLSASPELFFRRIGDRLVARPMKGTARRGRWLKEDERRAAELQTSAKDRAENLMIVDLVRNDLGRIAPFGAVRTERLFQLERYRTVHQLTSTVSAPLRPGTSLEEIFAALFPCGSVTGAPKIAAMRFIADLEDAPRGVYCGAVGVLLPGGDCAFNVPIRTVWIDSHTGEAEYGVGGGVTWDSTPSGEYDEAMAKAALLTRDWPDFELLETLRIERGTPVRLERHLARLGASARYFDYPVSLAAVRDAIGAHAREFPDKTQRARVLVSKKGAVRVESVPWDPNASPRVAEVALALVPVSRHDCFLFHKTTHRVVYEARLAERPGVFDVLLWNEERELTEFTRGNLVVELGGGRWTPPRESGLLAGTFRAELLERGEIRERVLRLEDLERATGVWLINGLREWQPVRLVG
jgi:para-aminobenzoate synthetase/4-amino-4-deoxychorismate lyase